MDRFGVFAQVDAKAIDHNANDFVFVHRMVHEVEPITRDAIEEIAARGAERRLGGCGGLSRGGIPE